VVLTGLDLVDSLVQLASEQTHHGITPHIQTPSHTTQDLPAVASRLLALRALLPGADVSAMVARAPELLLKTPVGLADEV
jgi:hypothetical protein